MPLLKSTLDHLLHLFYPHLCTGCGNDVLATGQQLCLHCLMDLPVTNFFGRQGNPVEEIFYGRLDIQHGAAGYFFTKQSLLQHLLHQLKYRGNKDIGEYMGRLLGRIIQEHNAFATIDALVPLPLNPRKERRRGYNQATMLCRGMAAEMNLPVLEHAVIRKTYTESQTGMGRVNRWQNMDGVFAIADEQVLIGKHLLLVDDVVTTGATLEACGAEILKIDNTRLSIATLAYTV